MQAPLPVLLALMAENDPHSSPTSMQTYGSGDTFDQTYTIDERDLTVSGSRMIGADGLGTDIRGPGRLEHFTAVAESKTFGIEVSSDSAVVIRDDWSELERMSTEYADIAAFEEGGLYTISVSNVDFVGSLSLTAFTQGTVTFDRIRGLVTISSQAATR